MNVINIFFYIYVSELIIFLRGNNILCIAEVLYMFINVINSFISVYDDAYVCMHACACSCILNLFTYIYSTFYLSTGLTLLYAVCQAA